MSWKSGFFNSVNGDRMYNAQDMSNMFKGLITNGIYESVGEKMAVQPNDGMVIQIATGRGYFNSHWVDNSTPYLITLESADVTLNRYCAVCIRVDESDNVRSIEPVIKYSDYATEPTKPTMEHTDVVNEYCLAYIYIGAGVTEITASVIEDTRSTDMCGWVTGLIEQIDRETLYTQHTALFYEWFNELQDIINENAEARLIQDVEALKGRAIKVTLNLEAENWELVDGVYTQTITVDGVNETSDIVASPITKDAYVNSGCEPVAVGTNTITFNCAGLPSEALSVECIIFTF
jgi:hypothetical protein